MGEFWSGETELLVDVLEAILTATRHVGEIMVVVEVISDSARLFYERHDFEQFPQLPQRRLIKLSSEVKGLGVA